MNFSLRCYKTKQLFTTKKLIGFGINKHGCTLSTLGHNEVPVYKQWHLKVIGITGIIESYDA